MYVSRRNKFMLFIHTRIIKYIVWQTICDNKKKMIVTCNVINRLIKTFFHFPSIHKLQQLGFNICTVFYSYFCYVYTMCEESYYYILFLCFFNSPSRVKANETNANELRFWNRLPCIRLLMPSFEVLELSLFSYAFI